MRIYNPLPHETIFQENAVEECFCKPFAKLERFPMTQEQSEILIRLLMVKKVDFKIHENEKPFLCSLIEKRVETCFTYVINDDRLILFLSMVAENPGNAVMYLAYLQYWCRKNEIKEVDLDIFCSRIFPVGFPKEDDLKKIWDGQKVKRERGSDNLLDYGQAYNSIQFLEPVNID